MVERPSATTQTEAADATRSERAATGISGLDEILGGGLPANRTYLVQGEPGVGKTTLGMQFLIEGVRRGERGVYVALSESEVEIRDIARSHGWDLEGIAIVELHATQEDLEADAQYTFFHPSEIELSDTARTILEEVERVAPKRIVFDSLSEMRLLARDSLRYRRQLLSLKKYFTEIGCTVLLLDVHTSHRDTPRDEFQLETLAHGFLQLEQHAPEYGVQRRRLKVGKLRGLSYQEGYHDFRIVRGGLEVYPRLVAADHGARKTREPLSSGLESLDRLTGGGLDRGATTMFLGPAGVGKSTLAARFLLMALEAGERGSVFLFDEGARNWRRRTRGLGLDFDRHLESGALALRQVEPAALSPGEFADTVRRAVDEEGVSVVLIDSMNGYRYAMPEEDFLTLHLHELFAFLNHQGVVTLVVVAQHGFLGDAVEEPLHISYLADSVILLRYFEAFGQIRKAVSTIKKRLGGHERAIRELVLEPGRVDVGEELRDFFGIIAGELEYRGERAPLLDRRTEGE